MRDQLHKTTRPLLLLSLLMGCLFIVLSATTLNAQITNPLTMGRGRHDESRWTDYAQFIPHVIGLTNATITKDSEGQKQWIRTTIASLIITEAMKETFDETHLGERPDDLGGKSFPSGHTSFACTGAAFTGQRYGWKLGLPAFAIASAVGIGRVESDDHYSRDVIAGCALAYGVATFFTTKRGMENVRPVIGPKFIGFRFGMTTEDFRKFLPRGY